MQENEEKNIKIVAGSKKSRTFLFRIGQDLLTIAELNVQPI